MDGDALKVVLQDVSLSGFLVGLLAQQEHSTFVIDALFQAEYLLKKLPDIYYSLFRREGVHYEIDALAKKSLVEDSALGESHHSTEDARESQLLDDSSMMSNTNSESGRSQLDTPSSPQLFGMSTPISNAPHHIIQPNSRGHRDATSAAGRQYLLMRGQLNRHQQPTSTSPLKADKTGIGHGSLRQYIILHAQYLLKEYDTVALGQANKDDTPDRMINAVEELKKLSIGLVGTKDDPTARGVLEKVLSYIDGSSLGISGFELLRSGVADALLDYLTRQQGNAGDNTALPYMATLQQRRNMLFTVFMETMKLDEENGVLVSPVLRLLVKRLETLFTQFERFEVVSPLDSSSSYSSSSDSMRNPVHLLAKQIKIRLTGQGDGIPTDCQHLIVSTHAVATFRVLEEYLLSRIDDTDTLMNLLNPGSNGDSNDDLNGNSSSEEMDQVNGTAGKSKVSDPTTLQGKADLEK